MARLTLDQKRKWSLIGGIAGLITGFGLIFFFKNNWGILWGLIGALLLVIRRNNG